MEGPVEADDHSDSDALQEDDKVSSSDKMGTGQDESCVKEGNSPIIIGAKRNSAIGLLQRKGDEGLDEEQQSHKDSSTMTMQDDSSNVSLSNNHQKDETAENINAKDKCVTEASPDEAQDDHERDQDDNEDDDVKSNGEDDKDDSDNGYHSSDDEDDDSDDSDDEDDDDDEDENGLSRYEKLRLKRIKRNQKYLAQLGLEGKDGQGVLGGKKKEAKSKRERKSEPLPQPTRTSLRRATKTKPINYNIDELDPIKKLRQEEAAAAAAAAAAAVKEKKDKDMDKNGTTKRRRKDRPKKYRLPLSVYNEFQRLKKQRRLNAIRARRHFRTAQREARYWQRQRDIYMERKNRLEYIQRMRMQREEEIKLLGCTKSELLQEIDRRTTDLWRVSFDYDQQQREKLRLEQQRLQAELERKQKEEFDEKMAMIDALDRFPKALKEATRSLNEMLLYRSPRDPPAPRRSKRKEDGTAVTPNLKKAKPKNEDVEHFEKSPQTPWPHLDTLKVPTVPTIPIQNDSPPPTESDKPQKKKRELKGLNVGGWISPLFSEQIDRSWLEREKPLKQFDLRAYVPQAGDTVLYYPGAHRVFLNVFQDTLGSRMRNLLRVPIWIRARRECCNAKKSNDRSTGKSWWNEAWITGIDSVLGCYPLLCRVERTHAEFPHDPYISQKVVSRDGNSTTLSWNLPETAKTKKRKDTSTRPQIRLAVTLKPLTPVLPPQWTDSGPVSNDSLSLAPNFTVVTFPSSMDPFLVPFSWAYGLTHSVSLGDSVSSRSSGSDGFKGKICDFGTLGEQYGSFSLMDKRPLIRNILGKISKGDQNAIEEALADGSSAKSNFPVCDAAYIVEFLSNYIDNHSSDQVDESCSMQGTLLDLIRSTLPLYKGIGIRRDVFHRENLYVSRWEISVRKKSGEGERPLLPVQGLPQGLPHSLENALRVKIVCAIQDFIDKNAGAAAFVPLVTEDIAPGYYCAVPIGMHLGRILSRLNCIKEECYYTSVDSILCDVHAIVDNCLLYNDPEAPLVTLCMDLIPALRRSIADICSKHIRERSSRLKDEERKHVTIRTGGSSQSPVTTFSNGDTSNKRRKSPPILDFANAPFKRPLNRAWLQTMNPDSSWNPSTSSVSGPIISSEPSLWIPQSGDHVLYSRSMHAEFVKGHLHSLGAEQCTLPFFKTVEGVGNDSNAVNSKDKEQGNRPSSKLMTDGEAHPTQAVNEEKMGDDNISRGKQGANENIVRRQSASMGEDSIDAFSGGTSKVEKREGIPSNKIINDAHGQISCDVDNRMSGTNDSNGLAFRNVDGYEASRDLAEKLETHWLLARIVGVRVSFPRSGSGHRDSTEDDSFTTNTPILVISLRFPYAWANQEVHVVCWRPCFLPGGLVTGNPQKCDACGLSSASFLRPAWTDSDLFSTSDNCPVILPAHDHGPDLKLRIHPSGIDKDSIFRCFDALKRRCLNSIDPDYVDPKLCLENAQSGAFPPAASTGARSLPKFDDFLLMATEFEDLSNTSIETRGIRRNFDEKNIRLLSNIHYLPAWSQELLKERKKASGIPNHEMMMPFPTLCLEMIQMRIKNGYYRQITAVLNDISEAYVTSVLYILSGPSLRKKNPLSIRKIAKHLSSPKGNGQVSSFVRPNQLKKKIKKHEIMTVSDISNAAKNIVNKPKDAVGVDFLDGFSEEEKYFISRIDKARKLYAMAIVSVTETRHVERIFGFSPRKITRVMEAAHTSENSAQDELDTAAISRIKFLIAAVGRDPSLNTFASIGEKILRITCGGEIVSCESETENGDRVEGANVFRQVSFDVDQFEKNDDLASYFFGRPGRRAPCVRCQVNGLTFFACRVRRGHSNPDFDFLENFKNFGGVDGLLKSVNPSQQNEPGPEVSMVSGGESDEQVQLGKSETVSQTTPNGILATVMDNKEKILAVAGKKQPSVADKRNSDDEVNDMHEPISDPTEMAATAQLAVETATYLFTQTQLLETQPLRLGKTFIDYNFPVDPSDGHYTWCIICGLSGNLLCCDGCSNVVHPKCVGLLEIPDDDWFCEECCAEKKIPVHCSLERSPDKACKNAASFTCPRNPYDLPCTRKDDQPNCEKTGAEPAAKVSSFRADIDDELCDEKLTVLEILLNKLQANRAPPSTISVCTSQADKENQNLAVCRLELPPNESSVSPQMAVAGNDNASSKTKDVSDAAQPKIESKLTTVALGTVFMKTFEGLGSFEGKVASLPTDESPFYFVEYEDGDSEDLTFEELVELLPVGEREKYSSHNFTASSEFNGSPENVRIPSLEKTERKKDNVNGSKTDGTGTKRLSRPPNRLSEEVSAPYHRTPSKRNIRELSEQPGSAPQDEQLKRKRGRPRKRPETTVVPSLKQTTAGKKRGRPRKSEIESTFEVTTTEEMSEQQQTKMAPTSNPRDGVTDDSGVSIELSSGKGSNCVLPSLVSNVEEVQTNIRPITHSEGEEKAVPTMDCLAKVKKLADVETPPGKRQRIR